MLVLGSIPHVAMRTNGELRPNPPIFPLSRGTQTESMENALNTLRKVLLLARGVYVFQSVSATCESVLLWRSSR